MAYLKRTVLLGLLVEAACLLVLYAGCFLQWPQFSKSFLLGGLVFLIPNTYFAWYAFRYFGASQTFWIVRSFYRGQTRKLALSAVAFALIFAYHKELVYKAVFLGFILMTLCHLVVAAWVSNRLAAHCKPASENQS